MFLFHSCPATRTFTAFDILPAETTTPTLSLDTSFRTIGAPDLIILLATLLIVCCVTPVGGGSVSRVGELREAQGTFSVL